MSKKGLLIESLDAFIRKYYKSRLIRGILRSLTVLLSLFVLAITVEYFGWFSTTVRTVIFWFFIATAIAALCADVLLPLLRMHRLAGGLTYDDAARIAGRHFPDIQDKLLNLLQLQRMDENVDTSTQELLHASINQKQQLLRVFPITRAVNLRVNWKFAKFAALPIFVIVALLIAVPSFVADPTSRLINHNTAYERPAPFAFVVENDHLDAVQLSDFEIDVAIDGSSVPDEVYITIDGFNYKMQQRDKNHFYYTVRNIQHSCVFSMNGGGVTSKEYSINVYNRPSITSFVMKLSFPSYTGRPDETLENAGDAVIPEGTSVKWLFQLQFADTLLFLADSTPSYFLPDQNCRLHISRHCSKSFNYSIATCNESVSYGDTMHFSIATIPDAYPQIAVIELKDSIYDDLRFFSGHIKDDYGFSKLDFVVIKSNANSPHLSDTLHYAISVSRETEQDFSFSFNLSELGVSLGDNISYYFEVFDNDSPHGFKSTKSHVFDYLVPTEEALKETLYENSENLTSSANASLEEIRRIQNEIDDIMRRMVDKKDLNWQDKQELKRLSEKQKELQNKVEQMKNALRQNNQLKEKYLNQSEQILEKQHELEQLMNQLMSDEMKKTLDEINRLMQDADKKQVQEQLESLKMQNSDLEKQIDQNIEIMKRLELESRVESAHDEAKRLADDQRSLSKETQDAKGKDNDSQRGHQEQLSNQFKKLQQELKNIKQDYKSLDPSANFNLDDQLQENIESSQKEAQNQLNKGNNKQASKQQQTASDLLDSLANQIEKEQERMEQDELSEDSELIRTMLKNLVGISFNQEELIKSVQETFIQDPSYQTIILIQNQIKENFAQIEDSLHNIAKRQIAVASAINKNLTEINNNISKSLGTLVSFNQSFYGNSKNTSAAKWMQYSMTSFNNLALMLAESLDNMQNQQRQSKMKGSSRMKSNGQCNNPGKNPSPKSMRQMQEQLNKQLEALKKQLDKDGNKQNGRKRIGEQNEMSEQLAKMAAQQELIRQMMQEYGQRMKESDASNTKLAKEIEQLQKQMEQTETDIINRTISQQTINRQHQIMTRLLEHEKAEMQRRKENKRESNEGKDIFSHSPSDIIKLQKIKSDLNDVFLHSAPYMSEFYKNKVNDYFFKGQ